MALIGKRVSPKSAKNRLKGFGIIVGTNDTEYLIYFGSKGRIENIDRFSLYSNLLGSYIEIAHTQ
jgi:hypothetical protein